MIEIRRAAASDYNETVDFLDFVFSKNSSPHDFPLMYPNLYRPLDSTMKNLINLYEDGALKASILAFPRSISIGGRVLKVYGIGSVACHPRERGRGLMSMLMKYNNEEMKRDGVHLSNLGGKRSRYNNFGFEIAGSCYDVDISPEAVKKLRPDIDGNGFIFREFSADDRQIVLALKEIYESKPVHYVYDFDDFFLRLIIPMSGAAPFAVYTTSNELIGYIVCEGNNVRELCLNDDALFSDVLLSYCRFKDCRLSLRLGEWQLPFARDILDISSEIELGGCGMWKLLRPAETVEALLGFKASYTALEPGRLVIGLGDGSSLAIEVNGKSVCACATDESPDFAFEGLEATRALLGNVPAAIFGLDKPQRLTTLFRSWFPLPLTWFGTERV